MNKIILATACALSLATTPVLAKENAKKPKVLHVCKKTDTAVNILACNVYMESRGEPFEGQMAIAFVTMNRIREDKFPSSVKHVVFQSKQFSWVGNSSKVYDQKSWEKAKMVASFVYSLKDKGTLYEWADLSRGSLFYHQKSSKPYWRHLLKKQVVIGNHIFYKEVS